MTDGVCFHESLTVPRSLYSTTGNSVDSIRF